MSTTTLKIPMNKGLVNSRDRESLEPGELQESIGIYFKPGDTRDTYMLPGRSLVGDTGSGSGIDGLALCQFDDTTKSQLVALSNGTLYGGLPGATTTFASLKTGLSASATSLSQAHFNNRWYLANGIDNNQVLSDDGTVRTHGMEKPPQAPGAVSALGSAAPVRGSATTGFTDGGSAYDTDLDTFAYLSTESSDVGTLSGFATDTAASARIAVRWGVSMPSGGASSADTGLSSIDGIPDDYGTSSQSFTDAVVTMELSEDGGTTYSTFAIYQMVVSTGVRIEQKTLTDGTDYADVVLRATLAVDGFQAVTFQLYTASIVVDSNAAAQTTTTPLKYGYLEFDQLTNRRGPISEPVKVSLLSENQVTLTRGTKVNDSATHWEVYRIVEGGVYPQTAGFIGRQPIGDSTFLDDLAEYASDVQPSQIYPMLALTVQGVDSTGTSVVTQQFYDRDAPPPAFISIFTYRGSIVGIPKNGRAVAYSMAGIPESFPALYRLPFDLEENDRVVAGVDMGGTALFFTEATVQRIDVLPRVASGSFEASAVEEVKGAPGCVGPNAVKVFSIRGETRAAYISPYGVYVTDGYQHDRITDDLDWTSLPANKSLWELDWDPQNEILMVGTGTSNAVYYLHMAPEHGKQTGQPTITGPHYGKVSSFSVGQVANVLRIYSGHASDGKVYLEQDGTSDASNSFDTDGTLVSQWKSGRIVTDRNDFATLGLRVPHSDFGVGETLTLNWTSGRYNFATEQTRTQTVKLTGRQNEQIRIDRSGEWHEFQFVYLGGKNGTLGPLTAVIRSAGRSSKVALSG